MLYKRASQITEEDLVRLVEANATEDERLEFKRQMYELGSEDAREMIRDISSLANQKGGLILIGVEEDDDGAASGVPGIEGAQHDERIVSSAQANIAPRLNGLEVASIPLQNGRAVVAVGIPESLNGPHMTTYHGESVFWQRHGRQKGKMSVDEIEAAFMRRTESTTRVESFLAQRRLHENLELHEGRTVMIQAAPVFLGAELVDILDKEVLGLLRQPPSHPELRGWVCSPGEPRPSLHGLRAEDREEGQLREYLELRREGYLEFGSSLALAYNEPPNTLPSVSVLGLVYSFVHLYRILFERLGVSTPAIFALTILNAQGHRLSVPQRVSSGVARPTRAWEMAHIEVPVVYVQDLHGGAEEVIRRLNDRLWNAFGFDRCWAILEDGSLVLD